MWYDDIDELLEAEPGLQLAPGVLEFIQDALYYRVRLDGADLQFQMDHESGMSHRVRIPTDPLSGTVAAFRHGLSLLALRCGKYAGY